MFSVPEDPWRPGDVVEEVQAIWEETFSDSSSSHATAPAKRATVADWEQVYFFKLRMRHSCAEIVSGVIGTPSHSGFTLC